MSQNRLRPPRLLAKRIYPFETGADSFFRKNGCADYSRGLRRSLAACHWTSQDNYRSVSLGYSFLGHFLGLDKLGVGLFGVGSPKLRNTASAKDKREGKSQIRLDFEPASVSMAVSGEQAVTTQRALTHLSPIWIHSTVRRWLRAYI